MIMGDISVAQTEYSKIESALGYKYKRCISEHE